jgi:hypothetical protein
MAASWLTRTMQAMSGRTAWLLAIGLWLTLCVCLPIALIMAGIWFF